MTSESDMVTKSIAKILDKLADRQCKFASHIERLSDGFSDLATFAGKQNSLNEALSVTLECIPQLIQKIQSLEADSFS